MISKATILHLRIPFSFYLLPFYIFALSQATEINTWYILYSFIIIHLLFYPSSNGYNSYYDKDEESIGGLKTPPPVSKELLYVSIAFEIAAIFGALLISWQFSIMIAGIAIVSRAYSHPLTRLKKFPILGLLTVALFQGAYTFFMAYLGITGKNIYSLTDTKLIWAGGLCSLMLFGSYPMTQVYQHREDGRRGDLTMSRMLGIKGTFLWTGAIFFLATTGFILYFYLYYSIWMAILFPCFLSPTLFYFLRWYLKVRKDEKAADFSTTMKLNAYSSFCFICFFIYLLFYSK